MFRLLIYLTVIFLCLNSIKAQSKGKLNIEANLSEERREFERLLIDILLNTLKPYKCVAIVCDQIYYNVFKDQVFKSLGLYISYFIILVEDYDDLLNPFPDTQEALLMVNRMDCQTYIILISNGLQMARLLRFGDRYRILNTRANFIILYDNRLFEKELQYIWKRIINVIFIKEYGGVKKIAGEKKIIPWFELSTVPFPSPIKGVLIPKRLDIWRQNKFRTGADLFRDKTWDLKNQTMKVATFQHIPAAIKVPIPSSKSAKTVIPAGELGFSGIEIEILTSIAQTMNFYPELYEPEDAANEGWGDKQVDGQYSGMFGELTKSHADIGLGDFYYISEILEMMDLTLPYGTECLTFLTPESLTDTSWKALILPFKPLMWMGVLLSLFICGIIFCYLARFHEYLNKEIIKQKKKENLEKRVRKINVLPLPSSMDIDAKYALLKQQLDVAKEEDEAEGLYLFSQPVNGFLYTFSMLLMVSLPKLPTGWSLRVLTGFYWLYCLLVVVAYRASMTAILANPPPRVTIDSLEALIESGLGVGGIDELNRDFFKTSLDPLSQEIGSKFEIINSTDVAADRIAAGKFALYENMYFLQQATARKKLRLELESVNSTKKNTEAKPLHIMEECVIMMPISIGLQKNSPIKPRIDKFIRRVIEAGLIRKWLDDVMQTTWNTMSAGDATVIPFMSLEKFTGAIVALFIGYFISISTFVAELIHYHRFIKRHPFFDKYSNKILHDKKK